MKILKGTSIYSIATGTCPVCQEESMYSERNPYNLPKVISMEERCANCNTKYQIEPSFFYGSMYVSYGVGVSIGITAFLIAHFIFHLSPFNSFIFITICILALFPIILRLSRNIWINLFLSYNPKYKN